VGSSPTFPKEYSVIATFEAGPFHASFRVPGDRAISHRAMVCGAAATGFTLLSNGSHAPDVMETCVALQALGVRIQSYSLDHQPVTVIGDVLRNPAQLLEFGNTTTATLILALCTAAGLQARFTLTEPIPDVLAVLTQAGATFETHADHMRIAGPLTAAGGTYTVKPAADIVAAVLLANLWAQKDTRVTGDGDTHDHMQWLLARFGASIRWNDRGVELTSKRLIGTQVQIPGDFSAAAAPIVAAASAPGSELRIEGVGVNPTRTALLDGLRMLGAQIVLKQAIELGGEPVADVHVTGASLRGASFDAALCARAGDELPLLVAAAATAKGSSYFSSDDEVLVDRLAHMLRAFAASIETAPGGFVVNGSDAIAHPTQAVPTFGDARIALAAAALSGATPGAVIVDDRGAIATLYPELIERWTRARR
jgi:3-phosphoshikimate 1-carboxyvinyltransferase